MLNEIRPHLHKYMATSMLLQDVVELLDREFEGISNCPACQSSESKFKFSKYDMKFDQCLNCQSIYMNPRPKQSSMDKHYQESKNYKYWAKNIFPESLEARRKMICMPSVERIKTVLKPYGKIETLAALEIGPGFGIFASYCLKEKVFSSYEVVEPTPPLAKNCRELGIEVHEISIEKFKTSKKYQFICAFEVIEHLYDPSKIVFNCNKLLSNKGFLVMSCPNGLGLDTKMLGSHSPSVDNEHVNLFSPKGIEKLLVRNGFKIISIQTPGKMDVEIIDEFIKESPGTFLCEEEFKRMIEECDSSKEKLQAKIASQKESGHMWVFAQKVS